MHVDGPSLQGGLAEKMNKNRDGNSPYCTNAQKGHRTYTARCDVFRCAKDLNKSSVS
jgi:hypothetical protein